ncbi:MAG: JAB domain-containing protein [Bacillota bacterium]
MLDHSSIVHPREVFKSSILNNSSSILSFHQHPSGDCSPSIEGLKNHTTISCKRKDSRN